MIYYIIYYIIKFYYTYDDHLGFKIFYTIKVLSFENIYMFNFVIELGLDG